MTDEPEQDRVPPRRKFDDVASLFGAIVPAPGAIPRPAPHYPAPPGLREPPQPVLPTKPPVMARAVPPEPPPPEPPPRSEPPAPPRQRPTELPWPDAFEPRPNFRRREPRNWSWLLLIPVGFVAAVGITTLDPRTIRTWLDAHVFHRTTVPAIIDAPLLAAPRASIPGTPTPSAAIPTVPSTSVPQAADPAPASAPAAEAPVLYPAIPTSPVPVPPGVTVSPPPVSPSDATASAAPVHVTIQYRRNIPGSEGEARRVAALLQSYGGSIELHPNTATVRIPTINYYNASDKAAATSLATVLANEASNWSVRAGATKYPPGTLDVWLP